jgi:hypothetical protein
MMLKGTDNHKSEHACLLSLFDCDAKLLPRRVSILRVKCGLRMRLRIALL